MSRIGEVKKKKIKEEILRVLYENNLKGLWTYEVADHVIRNNEFVLKLLKDLENDNLIKDVSGNKVRKKWMMSDQAYGVYSKLF